MGSALSGLKMGQLALDADLLKKLQNIDPANLRQLTKAEMEPLMEALKNGTGACKKCSGSGTNLCSAVALAKVWSQGGISRGPGEAPMVLNEDESHVGSTRMEGISNPDFSRAALGETLTVGQGEHEIDEMSYRGPQSAGTIRAAGGGRRAAKIQVSARKASLTDFLRSFRFLGFFVIFARCTLMGVSAAA